MKRFLGLGCWLGLAFAPLLGAPPPLEYEFSILKSGDAHIDGLPPGDRRLTTTYGTMGLLARQALGPSDWYVGYGLQADQYKFSGPSAWPSRLQALAVPLKLQYFKGEELAAEFSALPGFYWGASGSSQAWDVPVQLVSGVPLGANFNGVVGISNGRFYHHPLPIIGLVWAQSSTWRLEAVFPEPALIYHPELGTELRCGGELFGGGFRIDDQAHRSVVEYSSYAVGVTYRRSVPGQMSWSVGGGLLTLGAADFFRNNQRLKAGNTAYLQVTLACK